MSRATRPLRVNVPVSEEKRMPKHASALHIDLDRARARWHEVQGLAEPVRGSLDEMRDEARQSGVKDRDPAVEERPGGRKSSTPPAPSGPRM